MSERERQAAVIADILFGFFEDMYFSRSQRDDHRIVKRTIRELVEGLEID